MFKHNTTYQQRHPRGVSLLVVLSVLVILAIIAMVFVQQTSLSQMMGRIHIAKVQADMMAESGMEHVLSELRSDILIQPLWDDETENWYTTFSATRKDNAVNLDGGQIESIKPRYSCWHYVRNSEGLLVGRYAVRIQDESSKVNINVARALTPKMQNQGVGTFETILTSRKKKAGLPVSLTFGKNLLRYRYGRDFLPGQGYVDDNLTEAIYLTDLIDNDADGLIDEPNEGIDEPEEYDPIHPKWDDSALTSMREAALVGLDGTPPSRQLLRSLQEYGTVYTRSDDRYWDESSGKWQKKLNINAGTRRQMRSMLRVANRKTHFEPSGRNMRMLVANLTDYRDENHVLTTIGSDYGVEAVCFNEVMANDGSFSLRADQNNPDYFDTLVHRAGYWYERPDDIIRKSDYGYRIVSVTPIFGSGEAEHNGERVKYSATARVNLSTTPVKIGNVLSEFSEFRKLQRTQGGWPDDMWKNGSLMVFADSINFNDVYVGYPIIGNDKDTLVVACDNDEFSLNLLTNIAQSSEPYARINNHWRDTEGGVVCLYPQVQDCWYFPVKAHDEFDPPDDLYYRVYIAEQNLPGSIRNTTDVLLWDEEDGKGEPRQRPWKGFYPYLDVDGDTERYSETKMLEIRQEDLLNTELTLPGGVDKSYLLRTPYKDGEAIRARDGFIKIILGSTKNTGYVNGRKTSDKTAFENKHTFQDAHFIRPDIVEMINISDHAISLKNWKVVINTGSYADQVGLIESAIEYNPVRQRQMDNENPMILPGGYFYLTNGRDIFDIEYGSPRDGEWGTSAREAYPCYELPDALWGVRYRVEAIRNGDEIVCEGANWENDQMKYELCEWHLRRPRSDQNAAFGLRQTIYGNTRNSLIMDDRSDNMGMSIESLKAGDDVLILGMPRSGGFLSMTLKDQYNQITARTITYGSTEVNEIGYSTEKYDPTHYTWRKSPNPTFGGTESRARNHGAGRASAVQAYVKDNRFATLGEIQKVRKAEDWQNIGMEKSGTESTKTLRGVAEFFTTTGVRLDPEEEGVHLSGWKKAGGVVKSSVGNRITVANGQWEPNIWAGQMLRILTGKQKGESFSIVGSTASGITVEGYSVPGGEQLHVRPGDSFSVGPGYVTTLFYTRQNSDEGVWEWRDKGLESDYYGMYLFGLNDSIDTTEFLEENNNAKLEIKLFNFATREYDILPLIDREYSADIDDPYTLVNNVQRHQYEKSDSIYCGMINPVHISPEGGIRLSITAGGLGGEGNSGFAWLDYVYLSPGKSYGRINVNTASERVLRALNSIDEDTAKAIAEGQPTHGTRSVKPYQSISQLLDVKGMTADKFSKISSAITVRSDQYHVSILAQAIQDSNRDGLYTEDVDEVIAEVRKESIVDRTPLTSGEDTSDGFNITVLK